MVHNEIESYIRVPFCPAPQLSGLLTFNVLHYNTYNGGIKNTGARGETYEIQFVFEAFPGLAN